MQLNSLSSAVAADAAVVLRFDASGVSVPAAVSLIALSVDALGGVADVVLGPLHTASAAVSPRRHCSPLALVCYLL